MSLRECSVLVLAEASNTALSLVVVEYSFITPFTRSSTRMEERWPGSLRDPACAIDEGLYGTEKGASSAGETSHSDDTFAEQ